MNWKIAVGVGGVYILGGLATLAYIAANGDDRLSSGRRVFKGLGQNPSTFAAIAQTFLGWPIALGLSVGGK